MQLEHVSESHNTSSQCDIYGTIQHSQKVQVKLEQRVITQPAGKGPIPQYLKKASKAEPEMVDRFNQEPR